MNIRNILKKLALSFGFDLVRTNNFVKYPPARRRKLIADLGIDLIFDVGANTGQFALQMRKEGYKGRIISFEPMSSAFKELEKRAASDSNWEAVNIALGGEDGKTDINISENSYSSSILDIMPSHVAADASSSYVKQESVEVRRMDTIIDTYFNSGDKLYVKIDTQGYEKNIIIGAENSLKDIHGLQMEMSLVPLYQDELLMPDMIKHMNLKGFISWSFEEEFQEPHTGQLLQVNGIFVKNEVAPKAG